MNVEGGGQGGVRGIFDFWLVDGGDVHEADRYWGLESRGG